MHNQEQPKLCVISVISVNYKVYSDRTILRYFVNMNDAHEWALADIQSKKGKEILAEPASSENPISRITYNSYYGNYPCAYEFRETDVF